MLEANHGETGTTSESTGRFTETVRVLVVDHGHGLGAMAHDLLARSVGHSFEIQTTDSVSAAERIAAQIHPVLILIDGSFGLEAWRSLVDPSRHPDHGVVVLFNRHNPRAEAEARQAGAVDCLVLSDNLVEVFAHSVRRAALLRDADAGRRRDRSRLNEFASRLHGIMEAIPDQVVELSRTGKIVDANRAPRLYSEGTSRDAIGKNLSDLLDDQSTQIGLKTIAEVLETQQVISKISEIQYGGAKRYVDVRMAPYTADTVIAIVRDVTDRMMKGSRLSMLSDREREVMRMVAGGASNKQIAAKLDLSIKTIEAHRSRLMKKLGARNMAELMQLAVTVRDEL